MGERVHLRYWAHAFPSVISHLNHGAAWDFSAYQGIQEILVSQQQSKNVIKQASRIENFDRTLVLFPFDDKGYAELARIAFIIFGEKVSSILKMWFCLFGLSIFLFLIVFRESVWALVLLNFILLGVYAAIFAFPVSTELGEITNPRAIGMLSIVGVCHFLALLFCGSHYCIRDWIAAILQAGLITFVFFARSSEIWQLLLPITISLFCFIKWPSRRLISLFVISTLLLCFGALQVYQRLIFHPAYFETHGKNRLTWHNIGIGFALHPKLANKYQLEISDGSMFKLVADRAYELGVYEQVFTNQDKVLFNPIKDFVHYEKIAKSIVLEMAYNNLLSTIELYVVYKPLVFVKTLLDASSFRKLSADRYDFEVTYITQEKRDQWDAYFKISRPLAVFGMCLLVISMRFFSYSQNASLIGVILAIWLGSLVPAFLSYPLYHIIGMGFATTAAFVYLIVTLFVVLLTRVVTLTRINRLNPSH